MMTVGIYALRGVRLYGRLVAVPSRLCKIKDARIEFVIIACEKVAGIMQVPGELGFGRALRWVGVERRRGLRENHKLGPFNLGRYITCRDHHLRYFTRTLKA